MKGESGWRLRLDISQNSEQDREGKKDFILNKLMYECGTFL